MSKIGLSLAAVALLALAGCASWTPSQQAAATQSDQHTTAESGFGLGPENFNTNGGAFGPDQGDR